jgi:ganglioside-induced differentiation-associated protein 1
MLILYHGRTSVCSIKARLALAEKCVAFESRLMTLRGDQFDPDYMKLNPNAVVPTVLHDGKVVIESTVIMHYVDEAFPGVSLTPGSALERAQVRMTEKLMDEYTHLSCMTLTFATANRASLAQMKPSDMEAQLAKGPDARRSDIKREVVARGLDAAPVTEALRQQEKFLDHVEAAVAGGGPFIAGATWSLADAAAAPYVWRLDKLKLAHMWDRRTGVARWYESVRERPSFKTAVEDWLTPADNERYAKQPDPWPKVQAILRAA